MSSAMAIPSIFSTRSRLSITASRLGNVSCEVTSVIAPTLPPASSMINWVARSIARSCNVKSTPRSKRCDESVCSPYCRALPAMVCGAKNAHSKKIFCVVSLTAVVLPPMTPAKANACASSAMTKVLLSSLMV